MQKRFQFSKLLPAALFALALNANAQEASYKIYGFADASIEAYKSSSNFNTQFIGKDTLSVKLAHANVYFDFNPNPNLRALIEVGFNTNSQKNVFVNGTDASELLDPAGNALTNAQIIEMVTMAQVDSIAGASNLTAAQLEAVAPGTTAAVRAGVTDQLEPVLEELRKVEEYDIETRYRQVSIQRAHMDVLVNDQLNFRVGQFITPAGIWNEDHASPIILTVRQPLQTAMTPIFPESQLGMMVFGHHYLGDHELDYKLYTSTGRDGYGAVTLGSPYDNSIDNLGDLGYGGHVGLNLDYLKGIELGVSGMMGTIRRKYQTTQPVLDAIAMLQGQFPVLNLKIKDHMTLEDREFIGGCDLKVEVANLTLQGEFNYRLIDNELEKGSTAMTGFYGLAAYTFPINSTFSLTPYSMYEQVTWEQKDAGAGYLKGRDIDGFYMAMAGLNLGIYQNFRVKMELSTLQLLMVDEPEDFPSEITEKDMQSTIFSTQFSMAF